MSNCVYFWQGTGKKKKMVHTYDGIPFPLSPQVWRNCAEDYATPVTIWCPRPPEGFVSAGCVAVAGFEEPRPDSVYCVSRSLSEEAPFEEQMAWAAPDSYPWSCYVYPVQSEALHFVALRQPREDSSWKPIRVSEPPEEAQQPGSSRRSDKAEEK